MKLEYKDISNSLNKAYLAQCPFIDEINKFKENYVEFFKSIKPTDNEETLKDYLNNFLRDTYYKGKFLIKENHNNIDLVILNGKNVDNKIGVIVETKAIKSNEMITTKDLNKKAFQELIQYYLEERIINENLEIKHLIITNSIDWFIFNATEFERLFYQNKSFLKKYNDWLNQQLVSKNKDWFYSEIAKPFIETSEETIFCTYFQLSESSELSESSWIELYKVFSPENLLKLPFQNDSNTLNREFYNELLHIIGLYETKDNTRKIERLKKQDRNEGSLLENVISIIETDDIIQNLEQPERFGETQDEQIFSIALELSITWLNRILFLKLLESQLLKYNSNNQDFTFLNNKKIKDVEDLKELFFEILAVKPEDRKNTLKEKYKNVPYLNSSLFELTQLEKETVKINHLKQHTALPIYSATVLKDELGKKVTGKMPFLQYLFEFLDSYNFASDNKLEIQEQNKTIINSSVLGLIFEKINGYKEGSFFTPGYITMYICKDTIRKTVIQKFNSVYNWKCVTITDIHNKIIQHDINLSKANETFNSIRICDPAVGSGHFLVSALNELIAIKSELGILIDSEGQILRNTYCEVQNDELFINHFGQFFNYNYKDKESQRIQETIFKEKRTLIENCLFGVDINPKSVQICRLRLWIELLKNAYYTKETNFTNLETLPNIDINIKHGNSLVSFYKLNGNGMDKMQISNKFHFANEYKNKVAQYKNVKTKKEKQVLEKFILECKDNFKRTVNPADEDYKKIQDIEAEIGSTPLFFNKDEQMQWNMKLARLNKEKTELEKKYEEKRKEIYYNSFEWRFEFPEVLDDNGYFIGFDAIIGNPPYISYYSNTGENLNSLYRNYILNNYKSVTNANERLNSMNLFVELATKLVKQHGYISYILNKTFAVLPSYENIRKYVLQNTTIDSFATNLKPFDAIVDCCIIGLYNTKKELDYNIKYVENELKSFNEVDNTIFKNNHKSTFKVSNYENIISKINRIESKLCEFVEINRGVNIGGCFEYFLSDSQINENYKKYISGTKCIKPYKCTWEEKDGFMNFDEEKENELRQNGKTLVLGNKKRFYQDKLFIPESSQELMCALVTDIVYSAYGIMVATPKNNKIDLKIILALLNSKLLRLYVIETELLRKGEKATPHIGVKGLNSIPIPTVNKTISKPIIKLVDKILEIKSKNPTQDISKIENEIDKIVYKIYGIDETEIKIIEAK